MIASVLYALLPFVASVSAIVTPNTPDGSTVVNEGGELNVAWAADDTGSWTNVTIQLMTGDNFQMVPLQTLATGVDGTTTTTFTTPVPDVEPNSKIYFLQFTNNGETEATWTTRFTIAGADGSTTEPEQATQSNGDAIPWGIGAIAGDATNSTTPSGSMSSMSASMSMSASTSTGSGVTNYQPSSTGSAIVNPSNGSGPSRVTSASEAASSAGAAASGAASASTSPNAGAKLAAGGVLGMVGVVLGLFL